MARRVNSKVARPGGPTLKAPADGSSHQSESTYDGIVDLQRKAGNAAVAGLLTIQRHADPTVEDDTTPSSPEPQTLGPSTGGGEPSERPAEAPLLQSPGGLSRSEGPGQAGLGGLDLGALSQIRTPARLESPTAGRRFAREMVDEEHQWASQTGPDARARALTEMIGRSLTDAGVSQVPGYTLRTDLSPSTLGNFGFSNWRININQRLVARPSLTTEQANEIADTFFHEGRHCDQWFRMARLRAGQGHNAADIARSMGIPNTVAAAAANAPLEAASSEATEAQGWWDSVYGAHHDDRNRILGELAASDTANSAAAAAYQSDRSDANLAAWRTANERAQQAFTAYQALPEEVSARSAAATMRSALEAARRLNDTPADDPFPQPPRTRREGAGDFPVPAHGNRGIG